jgi:hypothetical protein
MKPKGKLQMEKRFNRQYGVAIDTVPLPEKPEERIRVILKSITPVINQIVSDAMTVAIGTWPTPEKPKLKH